MLKHLKIWESYQSMNEYLSKSLLDYEGKENRILKNANGDINKISSIIKELLREDPNEGYKAYKDLLFMHPEFRITQELILKHKEEEIEPIITLASQVSKAVNSFRGVY